MGKIVAEMRRAHWPLSILYSVNCPPGVKVAKATGEPLAGVGDENYSRLGVGSRAPSRADGNREAEGGVT